MSALTERLVRARDSLGDDGRLALTREHRDTLADATNALTRIDTMIETRLTDGGRCSALFLMAIQGRARGDGDDE